MYQPRRISGELTESTEADASAFRWGPRRAVRTRIDVLRSRVAPAAVSVALLAASGALALNLNASTTAVPAPVRADDSVSRDAARTLVSDDVAEDAQPTDEPTATSTEDAESAQDAAVADGSAETPDAAPTTTTFSDGAWQATFGAVTGEQFTQSTVVVRAQPSQDSAELGRLERATKVSVTDLTADGYRQVDFNGAVAYVWAERLGDQPPPEPTPEATPEAASPSASTGQFLWPTAGKISSPWGMRMHPILGYARLHGGADIGGVTGAPIYAVLDGTVTKAATGYNGGSGNNVRIDHGTVNGKQLETAYLHMTKLTVSAGQKVKRGQQIGTVGSTGLSTAPHLHFSVYVSGVNSDPAPYLN